MSLNRHAAKRDANEREIIATWERLGCWVETSSERGKPDTRVHRHGQVWRAEVKGAKRGLTEAQVENFTEAYRHGVPTYVVRTAAAAADLVFGRLAPWTPADGARAGAATVLRKHRPGYSKARAVGELCAREHCPRSRLPKKSTCHKHAKEAVFGQGPVAHVVSVTADAGAPLHVVREPGSGQLRAPQPSGRRRRKL